MEDIRLLVREEGRTARNLIAFNVPVVHTQYDSGKVMRKPPTSPRSHLELKREELARSQKRCKASQCGSRVRSASTGRDKRTELHARYWAFLFGNLERAVDEIYQTCESDESITECKEVMMVLDNYTREFRNLIDWFKIKWDYETTPPPQRPRSLAWEIRKSSPGKIRHVKTTEPLLIEAVKRKMPFDDCSVACVCDNNVSPTDNSDLDVRKPDGEIKKIEPVIAEEEVKGNTEPDKNILEVKVENQEKLNGQDVVLNPSENLNVEASDVVMVDEICQTDREEDVDENGPKYRCVSQQTCPILSGLDSSDIKLNVNDSPVKKEDSSIKPVPKTPAVPANQTPTPVKANVNVVKTPVKNSYSFATTNQIKSGNVIQPASKTTTPTRTAKPIPTGAATTSNRAPFTTSQRQPWGARPLSTIPSKQSAVAFNSGYSSVTRLTRSRTIAEVRQNGTASAPSTPTAGSVRSARTVLAPKQNVRPHTSTIGGTRPAQVNQLKLGISRNKTLSLPVKTSKDIKEEIKLASKQGNPSDQEKGKMLNSNTSLNSSASSGTKGPEISESTETLTPDNCQNEEDDGWVKVRSRSRYSPAAKIEGLETTLSRSASNLKSRVEQKPGVANVKMHPKTRFHQPSSAISLPTLAFSLENSKENVDNNNGNPKKSEANKPNKPKTEPKIKAKENQKPVKKSEPNNRMKSNNEKLNKRNATKLLNEKNSNKTDKGLNLTEKIENEKNLSKTEKLEEKTIIIDQEDVIDEDENHFDEEIKKNTEEEEMLQKEIKQLEASDIEVDTETGDEETDGETTTGTEDDPEPENTIIDMVAEQWDKIVSPKKTSSRYENKSSRYENKSSGYEDTFKVTSWSEQVDNEEVEKDREAYEKLERLIKQDCTTEGLSVEIQNHTLNVLEEIVGRHPGRALELHQKLSSPSRRRTIPDTLKKFQARQAKALAKREQLKKEKAQRLQELLNKVKEVKAAKDKLIEDRRQRLEMKQKRAAENRSLHLKEIKRKAHDEEEKLKEIAFINELEAQNRKHDFMTQCQEQEDRLQGIHEERQRKQEEKAAKEAAVEERRKAIEAERQEKLEKMQERQRKRDEQADKKKQEKEKERQELAREKARDRTERLEALHAAQLEAQEELQKKIQQKQEESARRHEENIEQIRQKALELSILKCSDDVAPKLAPYETQKLCTACNVLIGSEVYLLSHLRGRKHQEAVKNQHSGKDLPKEEVERYNIKLIVNAPADKIDPKIVLDRERVKSFKKRCKKIRMRMNIKGAEYLSKTELDTKIESPNKGKLQKCLKDIEKTSANQGKGQWSDSAVTALERAMGEIGRTLNKQDADDQNVFKSLNGFTTLCNILQLDMDVPQHMAPYLPQKCYVTTCATFLSAVNNSVGNSKFIVLSNKIATLLDLLLKRLTVLVPDNGPVPSSTNSNLLTVDPVASSVMRVIAKILVSLQNVTESSDDYLQRLQDVISYTVSVGIVDKLTRYCKSVRDPIDDDPSVAQFLLSALDLLTTLTARCKTVQKNGDDPTQLLATLQVTELVGAVSILYGMLLHQGAPPKLQDSVPPVLPSHTVAVALATIRLLRSVAELDLQMFQSILGAEGISLQFRHIASYLLWYCCHDKEKDLLHEVVAVVGYFAVQHRDNQMILQSGSMPTVLQQLCNLPFPYFSNPELSALLFPTLLACCRGNEENKAILEQEISYSLLEDFLESDDAKNHPLVKLLPDVGGTKS